MQIIIELFKPIFYFVLILIVYDFITGLLRAYCPEALPPILRGKKEMLFETVVYYNGEFGITTHKEKMEGRSLYNIENAVSDELNKKKFITLGSGLIIPTRSIVAVKIKEVVEEAAG